MVNRHVRLSDLLERLGKESAINHTRELRKSELLEICDRLEIDVTDETKNELRGLIRQQGITHTEHKSDRSRFATRELLRLNRALTHQERLDAEDVSDDMYDTVNQWGGYVEVNGESYEVVEKGKGPFPKHAPSDRQTYEMYEVYYLGGKRRRLMILHGLDTDTCRYDNSVVFEEAHDYGPYKRWKKDEYVTELNYEAQHPDRS